MEIIELPHKIVLLLDELSASKRLRKHLQIVYSTAYKLTEMMTSEWPDLKFNRDLILFGAGTHDIGKSLIINELYEKGKNHEMRGKLILENLGFKKEESRFALTHGNWTDCHLIEDLIVCLSDKIWKGKRVLGLEEKVCKTISGELNIDFWEVYIKLDEILSNLSNNSDELILWQNE